MFREALKEDKEIDIDQIIGCVLKESRKDEIVYKTSALQSLGDILSALDVDKFEQVYEVIEPILTNKSSKEDDDNTSSEEIAKKRQHLLQIHETAYETLGKSWPRNRQTQQKYRLMFVEHCVNFLPIITRSVQVSLVGALYNYVDKLMLLDNEEEKLNADDEVALGVIVDKSLEVVKYALTIGKHTRLRKESLNVVFCLGKKLKDRGNFGEFKKLQNMFEAVLPDLLNDNQPEVKSRLTDIKNLLN